VIAVVALTSGCGAGSPASSAAPNNGGGSTRRSSGAHHTDGAAANAEAGVKFAGCMRSHGVSNFPDPSASQKLTLDGIVNGSSLDPNSPAFVEALRACKSLEPAGFTGSRRSPDQTRAALKFAQCIRENGVPDFPDPVNGQPLVDTNRIPSANRPGGLTILNAAMQTCASLGAQARGIQ
jgi:hypothetical protein